MISQNNKGGQIYLNSADGFFITAMTPNCYKRGLVEANFFRAYPNHIFQICSSSKASTSTTYKKCGINFSSRGQQFHTLETYKELPYPTQISRSATVQNVIPATDFAFPSALLNSSTLRRCLWKVKYYEVIHETKQPDKKASYWLVKK